MGKWNELTAHLNAHATLTPTALYTKTIAELNSLIEKYKNATANRSGTTPAPLLPPLHPTRREKSRQIRHCIVAATHQPRLKPSCNYQQPISRG
jgi:hypothetical protein